MALTITKFTHSCLLIEHEGRRILTDPGVYSQFYADAIQANGKVKEIIITHEHPDHFSLDFVRQVVADSPEVRITTTQVVANQLLAAGIQNVTTAASDDIVSFAARHEDVSFASAPDNIGVHLLGVLTHPGDSLEFVETKQILAMPMTAPWGSMHAALDKILELKPKFVIPIHDWHWRPEALKSSYGMYKQELAKEGIELIIPTEGEAFTLDVL